MSPREQALCDLVRLGFSSELAARIVRELPAIQRAHEAACNWPEDVAKPFEAQAARAAQRVASLLGQHARGYVCARQRDPRGGCLELYLTARATNRYKRLGEPLLRLCARGFTAKQVEHIDRQVAYAQRQQGAQGAQR